MNQLLEIRVIVFFNQAKQVLSAPSPIPFLCAQLKVNLSYTHNSFDYLSEKSNKVVRDYFLFWAVCKVTYTTSFCRLTTYRKQYLSADTLNLVWQVDAKKSMTCPPAQTVTFSSSLNYICTGNKVLMYCLYSYWQTFTKYV